MTNQEWAKSVSEKIKQKMKVVAERSRGIVPYTTVNGRFDDKTETDICWWTNGFWGGILWQLYYAAKEPIYRELALELEEKLDENLMTSSGMDHDSGFRWLPTSVANYRLHGDKISFNRGMTAANDLAGRFNPVGNFIRAWNDAGELNRAGWAIIDCMMNLPLLYWAFEVSDDPRYLHIATRHADTAEKAFVRPDGSCNHIVEFDPWTGEYIQTFGGQGAFTGSSWTRGQAWALYGFVLSSIHTAKVPGYEQKSAQYLGAAKRVAHYFIANTPDSGLIPVDFRQPAECTWEDSTAAAIAACGLLEIARLVDDSEKQLYEAAAMKMLRALDEKRSRWDTDCDNILEKCTAAYHDPEHEFSIIYGDYYFIEAIWKLTGEELFIW